MWAPEVVWMWRGPSAARRFCDAPWGWNDFLRPAIYGARLRQRKARKPVKVLKRRAAAKAARKARRLGR